MILEPFVRVLHTCRAEVTIIQCVGFLLYEVATHIDNANQCLWEPCILVRSCDSNKCMIAQVPNWNTSAQELIFN